MSAPRLVTVAHGTRHPTGNDVAREVTERAGRLLGWPARTSYVELCEPSLGEAVAGGTGPVVVVPLLLSTGHHVRVDLPRAVAAARGRARLAPHLGPHPLLAEALASRLDDAGARPEAPVVLVAAGSRDPAARTDLARARRLLAGRRQGEVRLATLSGPGPRPADVVRRGDAVVPYLLAPGHFLDRAVTESAEAGAAQVAGPLGAHAALVELVARRAVHARRASTVRSTPSGPGAQWWAAVSAPAPVSDRTSSSG